MLEIYKYTIEHKQEWDKLVSRSKNGTFLLHRDYMDYHSDRFHDHSFIVAKNGRTEAVIPGNIDNSTFYSHQGLTYGGLILTTNICTNEVLEIFKLLNHELQKSGIKEVIYKPIPSIYHNAASQEDIYALFLNKAEKISCNISTTIYMDNLLKFRESRNGGIRKSKYAGVIVTESDKYSEFWEILTHNTNIKYHENPTHSITDITLLKTRFPDNIKLYLAYKNDHILAGVVVFISKNTLHVQYISSNEQGKCSGALDLIFYELIHIKFPSVSFFDFGISTEKNGNYLNKGLIFQKEGFGGRGIVYETYKYKIQNDTISVLNSKDSITMKIVNKYGIILRLVEESDADFILKLRTDIALNRFISYTSPQRDDQLKWIQEYKLRENAGLEYYYIAQDQDGNKYGTIRIYNLDDKSFELGSWLFHTKSPIGMAVKAHFMGFEIGFELLKAEYCRFEIRKKNTGVLRYMQDFEKTLVKEDDLNYYFTLTKENFFKRRNQLSIFNSSSKNQGDKIYIHPTAEVQTSNIGVGTSIWQFCVVLKDAVIGKNCNLNFNVFVENDVIIGDNVTIKSGVQLWDGLRMEDNVFISPNVAFTNDFAPRSKQYPNKFLTTMVNEGASIGANSTIIGGITIGKYAMVGAASLVNKNIPDYNLWYGHPATFKAYICKCGHKLNDLYICDSCNKRYKSIEGIISEL